MKKPSAIEPRGIRPFKSDPLRPLEVIDRLEVGPISLEKNRLTAPYTVIWRKRQSTTKLIYRFEENVFEIESAESRNLASMIAAQVAINYGLFCRQIVFNGSFDRHDQRFILDMAENTAREIYVKKFLEPNPFLVGDASRLPAIKQRHYLRAQIIFKKTESSTLGKSRETDWKSDQLRYAVLSSGGKDSLLSFSLLDELGYSPHPIFVNESGRHWYTALNSYRYFKRQYPETARVWTNADRVFSWMLRHLPFIRRDFAGIRSDEYPVRLWTVAVFLFGALPILRKRGLGALVIGDEHDTTRRLRHKGIPHYDGLYDQSRYFDNAMTRYFARKGWNIRQFSILRPLSEPLIERILVERYPKLQRHQVSCHATHIRRGRVYPCGDCEKCRRVVGMLLALGADPRRCGYSRSQVESVLRELSDTRLRQDAASAEHLLHLLRQKGLISGTGRRGRFARAHPEIVKVMIDYRKSPSEEIPANLRPALFKIYLEYAAGAAKRHGNSWIDFDLLSTAAQRPL